jgi:hypothetical protein
MLTWFPRRLPARHRQLLLKFVVVGSFLAAHQSLAQEATITTNYTSTPTDTPTVGATITPNHTETPTLTPYVSPTPYIPPPTPQPYGRPGTIECWPGGSNPRIACCYEWRGMITGNFADGHWIFLNCVATSSVEAQPLVG